MWRLRELYRSFKNLVVWFPIIWKDRQWDRWYIEVILLKKISLMRKYHEERQFFVGWENEVKWMKTCERLLEYLTKDKYWDDKYDNKIPSKNSFVKMHQDRVSMDYINWKYESYNNPEKENVCYADLWEMKARSLFWKIFTYRYESWWD
jgi:hypothetical protein